MRNYMKWNASQWTGRSVVLLVVLAVGVAGAAMLLKNDPAAGPMNGVPSPAASVTSTGPAKAAPARKPAPPR